MGIGEQWFINIGSSVVTNVLLCWEMLVIGKAIHEWVQGVYGKSFAVHIKLKKIVCLKKKTSGKQKECSNNFQIW